MSSNLLSIFVILAIFCGLSQALDYCNDAQTKCNGYPHVACGNSGKFGPECRLQPTMIPMTAALKDLIVTEHNKCRNEFARGVDNFKPAVSLGAVMWDNELAQMAEYNVKKCDVKLDECRNTLNYHYVGQNTIAWDWDPVIEPTLSIEHVLKTHVRGWYQQKRYATQKDMDYYPSILDKNSYGFGFFATMIGQKATRVGCAALRDREEGTGRIRHITTCNYSHDIEAERKVYESGTTPASKCKTHAVAYKNLCHVNEKVFWNYLTPRK